MKHEKFWTWVIAILFGAAVTLVSLAMLGEAIGSYPDGPDYMEEMER